jgi:hypothetical protein
MKLYAVQFKDSLKVEWITDGPNMGNVFGATVLHSIDIVAPKKKVGKTVWINFYNNKSCDLPIMGHTTFLTRSDARSAGILCSDYVGTFPCEIEVDE